MVQAVSAPTKFKMKIVTRKLERTRHGVVGKRPVAERGIGIVFTALKIGSQGFSWLLTNQ